MNYHYNSRYTHSQRAGKALEITLAGKCKRPRPPKLTKEKRLFLTDKICAILQVPAPSPFYFEGPCVTGIRRGLIKQNWPWFSADLQAREIVNTSLLIIGAIRPTWQEGQREWTMRSNALSIKRDRCKNCSKPIPEGRWRFCSSECSQFWNNRKGSEQRQADKLAMKLAEEAA